MERPSSPLSGIGIRFLGLERRAVLIVFADAVAVAVAVFLGFMVRFGWVIPAEEWRQIELMLLVMLPVRLGLLALTGMYRWSFRHASVPEFTDLTKALVGVPEVEPFVPVFERPLPAPVPLYPCSCHPLPKTRTHHFIAFTIVSNRPAVRSSEPGTTSSAPISSAMRIVFF